MNIGLFFNPNGRITKAAFQSGALVLIVISFVFALMPLVASGTALMAVSSITTLIGLVMIWCWIALWVKRLHQGGITGWMVVLLGFGWFVVNMIVGTVITVVFAPDLMGAAPEGDGFMDIMQQSIEASQALAVPNAVAGALVSLAFVFIVNAALPSQDGENQYGPAPAQ